MWVCQSISQLTGKGKGIEGRGRGRAREEQGDRALQVLLTS